MQFKLIRDVTPEECHWLKDTMKKDAIVYLYNGCTYGCCDEGAYTIEDGVEPFFELPDNAVERIAKPILPPEEKMNLIKIFIEEEMQLTFNQINVEKLGGNVVKENWWKGEHTGLKKALSFINEIQHQEER